MLGHAQDGVQRIRLVQRTLAPSAPLIICPSLRGVSVSPSSTGAGEYITRMSLARAICEGVEAAGDDGDTHGVLQRVIGGDFLREFADCASALPSPSWSAGDSRLIRAIAATAYWQDYARIGANGRRRRACCFW